jgi:O-acetyl-ADP-ribose deacetylase (regulator of RNase III)
MSDTSSLRVDRAGSTPATIELAKGDITTVAVDAIVNAANSALAGGGGVDGAIHRAAGPELMAELSARYRGCPTGSAVITGPGRLSEHRVQHVIHAVGPVWRGGGHDEEAHLRSAYMTSLRLAGDAGAGSVAFPAISAGIYGYPLDQAARVAVAAVRDGLIENHSIQRAVFVLFSRETFDAFAGALAVLPDAGGRVR